MEKKSYSTQMAYEVSDAEKAQAEKALLAFNYAQKTLKQASDHLKIMETPFNDHPDINTEQIVKFRAALRRFRDKSIETFNAFKIAAFHCISLMQMFSSDTQTVKILKSFINAIDDLEKQVNDFADLFTELESKTFVPDIIKSISLIQKSCADIENMINERIKTHLRTNIIGKNWMDGVSSEMDMKIEKGTPIMLDLQNQRQEQLNQINKKR